MRFTAREWLIHLHNKYNGDWVSIRDAIINNEPIVGEIDLSNEDSLITIIDSEYPDNLRHACRPPFVVTKELLKAWRDTWAK